KGSGAAPALPLAVVVLPALPFALLVLLLVELAAALVDLLLPFALEVLLLVELVAASAVLSFASAFGSAALAWGPPRPPRPPGPRASLTEWARKTAMTNPMLSETTRKRDISTS